MKIDNFKNLKNKLNDQISANKKILDRYIDIRLFAILALVVFVIAAIKNNNNRILFITLSVIAFLLAFILTIISAKYKRIDKKLNYKCEVINAYLNRFNDKYKKLNNTGNEFAKGEYFETDLDIFGKQSLYTYLCFARTPFGKKELAESLEAKISSEDEILSKEKAISELSDNLEEVVNIESAAFEYDKLNTNVKLSNINDGLKSLENVYKPSILKIILSILYFVLLVTITVISCLKIIPVYTPFIVIFAGFFLSIFINPEAARLSDDMSNARCVLFGYDELIDEINRANFKDNYLQALREPVLKLSGKNVRKFNIISGFAESRKNILFQVIFNGLFMADSYIVLAYNIWQKKYKDSIKDALESIGKIESLISLSTISLVKENVSIPKISNKFEFEDIRHPLIEEDKCIPNSFKFVGRNIITGSNMSGKTTFMRSIGTNYILYLAGAFVCATKFEAPLLKLFTSMKVVDDVNNNISTFYGEILRIKAICDYTKEDLPMLVLVDEIFKGTNTKDRIVGATSAIEKLNKKNIYSIVTTHDPELCQIENVNNYHFLEHYEDDKILFDYKIHDGISNTRNAIYLLKIAGIIDENKKAD